MKIKSVFLVVTVFCISASALSSGKGAYEPNELKYGFEMSLYQFYPVRRPDVEREKWKKLVRQIGYSGEILLIKDGNGIQKVRISLQKPSVKFEYEESQLPANCEYEMFETGYTGEVSFRGDMLDVSITEGGITDDHDKRATQYRYILSILDLLNLSYKDGYLPIPLDIKDIGPLVLESKRYERINLDCDYGKNRKGSMFFMEFPRPEVHFDIRDEKVIGFTLCSQIFDGSNYRMKRSMYVNDYAVPKEVEYLYCDMPFFYENVLAKTETKLPEVMSKINSLESYKVVHLRVFAK